MRVLVTGANGFIGAHTTLHLFQEGHIVRGLIRPGAVEDGNIAKLRSWNTEVVEGDFGNPDDARRVCQDIDAVVHLIGSIKAPKRGTFTEMHRTKTEGLVAGAKAAGVKRIVYISAPGAAADAKSEYLKTKFEAEEIIRNSGLESVILRVSLVAGKRCGVRDSKLMRRLFTMAQTKRKMPVMGDGSHPLQPIHVWNLVEIIARSVVKSEVKGKILGIGGPEVVTMGEIVRKVLEASGNGQKPVKYYNLSLIKFLIPIFKITHENPPVEKAQILALEETGPIDLDELRATFPDVNLVPFDEALKEY